MTAAAPGTRPLLPPAIAVPVALLAGLALEAAFPSPGTWLLAPLGLAALLLAVHGRRPWAAAGLGLLTGVVFLGALLSWTGVYVGWIAWLPLAFLQALFVAAFAALVPFVHRAPGGTVVHVLGVASLWVGVEALRGRLPFGGFGWGRLAFSQSEAPTVGLAALGGAPLVSFAVALAGACTAAAVVPLVGRRWTSSHGVRRPLAGLTVAVAVLAVGLAVPLPTAAENGHLRVAGIQGNVPRPGLDFNAERRAVLDNHARATLELATEVSGGDAPAPDVVLWPENSSDIDPLRNEDAATVIDDAARAVGVPVVVGAVLRRDDDRLSNTVLVWEPEAGAVDRYTKQRPVPFAEYVPHRDLFRRVTSAVDLVARDFVAGSGPGLVDVAGTPLGTLICFEVVPDDLARASVLAGAEVLFVPTNNATFGYTDESVQQLAISRLRAVEHGRAVAHVSTVGVSALVEPDGAVLADTALFTTDVLAGELPRRTTTTLATRLGALPEVGLAALAGLVVLAGALTGRRRTAATDRVAGPGDGGPDNSGTEDSGTENSGTEDADGATGRPRPEVLSP